MTSLEYYIEQVEQFISALTDDIESGEGTVVTQTKLAVYREVLEHLEEIEQEPCEDEYIKVPKKALKYRTAGMVAYNVEWLKNHFDIERAVICGAKIVEPQERSGDLENLHREKEQAYMQGYEDASKKYRQEPKTGHWEVQPSNKEMGERDFIWWKCSECGQVIYSETEQDKREYHAFCGRCGARMVEPQERSE